MIDLYSLVLGCVLGAILTAFGVVLIELWFKMKAYKEVLDVLTIEIGKRTDNKIGGKEK